MDSHAGINSDKCTTNTDVTVTNSVTLTKRNNRENLLGKYDYFGKIQKVDFTIKRS
jgi:hypothetical protein